MKAKLLITILLILLGTAIFASEDPFDAEEYVRKTQELNQLAERFKAETGFRGNVSYDLNRMCLGYYEGKFADIQITAEADTASFRTAFEQIMDKVLPYTFARREQLARTRITNMHGRIKTVYYQQVNGYRVEGAAKLSIAYESGRNAFAIGNGTVELPEVDVLPVLSYDDAVRIYDENVEDDEAIKNMRKRRPFLGLLYCDVNKGSEPLYRTPDYRLCWTGGYTMTIYIDAVTGRVYKTIDNTMYDYTVNVTAKVMKDADNNGSFAISNVSLDSTWVRALCDSINDSGYTDSSGNYCFLGNTTTDFESYLSSSSGIQVNHNNGNLVMQNSSINNLPNLDFDYSSIQGNPSNLYYHALQFRKVIRNLMDVSGSSSLLDSTSFEPFIQANCTLANGVNGTYTPSASNYGLISITTGNGNYYSTLCHEMTHDIVYRSLQYNRFRVGSTSDIQGGMDEAFSSYFPCAYKNNPKYRTSLYNKDLCDSTLMVKNYQTTEYPNIHIDESLYARYHMRFPLASAWWSLRSNPLFPNSVQGVCGVDTLLVNSLEKVGEQIPQNSAYRYKPRYFYNILMKQVDEDNNPYPLNPKQIAIDEAYRSRGFHFTSQVISAGVPNPPDGKDKNMFRLCDSLYVKVTNCPQNTPLTVYVVEDQDYTDGMHISALNTIICQVSGTSNNDGVWYSSTPVMTTTTVGDFDILVDIGNNGVLHYGYTAANIRDGFDGLEGPGFTVYDDGITIVLMGSERNSSPCSK